MLIHNHLARARLNCHLVLVVHIKHIAGRPHTWPEVSWKHRARPGTLGPHRTSCKAHVADSWRHVSTHCTHALPLLLTWHAHRTTPRKAMLHVLLHVRAHTRAHASTCRTLQVW
jgi:hypothetical protein